MSIPVVPEIKIGLTKAITLLQDPKVVIKRYCFRCKKVTSFSLCECNKYYCREHAERWQEGDWESGYFDFTEHKGCKYA